MAWITERAGEGEHRPDAHLIDATHAAGRASIAMHKMKLPAGRYAEPPAAHSTVTVVPRARGDALRDFSSGRIKHRYRHGDIDLISPSVGVEIVADGPQEPLAIGLPQEPAPRGRGQPSPFVRRQF